MRAKEAAELRGTARAEPLAKVVAELRVTERAVARVVSLRLRALVATEQQARVKVVRRSQEALVARVVLRPSSPTCSTIRASR
jgi:hypothetical protein